MTKNCLNCNKEFIDKPSHIEKRKFCSWTCRQRPDVVIRNKTVLAELNRGKHRTFSSQWIENMRQAKIGKMVGEKHWNWKGGYQNTLMLNRNRRIAKRGNGGSHSLQEWSDLKTQYGHMCLCCKRLEPEITLTEDHIVPLYHGGTNDISNIQPLCQSCNSRKKTKIISYRNAA